MAHQRVSLTYFYVKADFLRILFFAEIVPEKLTSIIIKLLFILKLPTNVIGEWKT